MKVSGTALKGYQNGCKAGIEGKGDRNLLP